MTQRQDVVVTPKHPLIDQVRSVLIAIVVVVVVTAVPAIEAQAAAIAAAGIAAIAADGVADLNGQRRRRSTCR
ncbi:hypothetical protein [Peterkaempfera bronchialis]|uniref:hypothetical protein n=1 Tax=Peterkaempfera bronchialis TaxID=2126346 RepID=UPI003C2E1C49